MKTSLCILVGLLLAFHVSAGTVIWDAIDADADGPFYEEGKQHYELWFGCMITGDGFRATLMVRSTFAFSGGNVVVSPSAMDVGSGKFIVKAEEGDLIDAEYVRDEDRLFDNNWGIGYEWDEETGEEYDNRHKILSRETAHSCLDSR